MRWLYPDPGAVDENNLRHRVMKNIDAFWWAFSEEAPTIREVFRNKAQMDLPKWMHENLQCIQRDLCWEFGPGVVNNNGDRLVITPESNRHLRPFVDVLLSRQPKLPDWEFFAYRPADDLPMALQTVKARTRGDISGARVTVRRGAHNRIDLIYHHQQDTDHKQARHEAFVATESLLGEEILDHWIGGIDAETLSSPSGIRKILGGRKPQPGISLDQLKPTVDALIESIREQLPSVPVRDWPKQLDEHGEPVSTLLRIPSDPPEQADYPRRDDLLFAGVDHVELFNALHSGVPFHSPRYSRVGETFCYLKIDHREQNPKALVDFRAKLEDPLGLELQAANLGSHIGGGTGRMYAYIFLALGDVPRAIDTVRQTLRAHLAPKRSWLLFYDADLAAEWIGIWDDTPPPPVTVQSGR